MSGRGLDYWRKFFRVQTSDIFEIIECGIMVAAADSPTDFTSRRGQIAELLFSCQSSRQCVRCDRVEFCTVPVAENDDVDVDVVGRMKKKKTSDDDNYHQLSYEDAEALTDEIEQGSQLVGEVLRIKEILTKSRDESESVLFESLRKLQFMALTVDILKSTEIGKAVNGLRRHSSSNVRHLAKLLIELWKEMVDEWVKATKKIVDAENEGTPDSVNPSVLDEEEGLPSPMDEEAFFVTLQDVGLSQFFDGMDDDENLRNSGEFSKNRESGRKASTNNHTTTKQKPHPTNNGNVLRKEHFNVHDQNQKRNQITISRPKTNAEPRASSLVIHQQALDKTSPQRKSFGGQHDKLKYAEVDLEATKKRLQERYEQAENAKKQHTIQVLDVIPKQAARHPKKPQGRTRNLNRQRLFGKH